MWSEAELEPLFRGHPAALRAASRAHELLCAAAHADPARVDRALAQQPARAGFVLRALAGVAPFLARVLARHPHVVADLLEDDLALPRSLPALEAGLAAALDGAAPDEVSARMRRFKYAELARVTVRDAAPELVPEEAVGETLAELSGLAEALLAAATRHAAAGLEAELGAPLWRSESGEPLPLAFGVLGLGKLGGGELNYSSDVDLIYVYEHPGTALEAGTGPSGHTPGEYFTKLARRLGPLIQNVTDEGFLYRVDLDLRPEGASGPVVLSDQEMLGYYDGWAQAWEKSAFMKARPVAGNLSFGWNLVREIHPMVYQTSVDYRAFEALREMKARVEAEHENAERDVKLGAGGIRDVEFVAQALQLLHGGRMPQVRGRSAQTALAALAEVGALQSEDADALLAAWRFLRRVENRLQMEEERQTHALPSGAEARERLAWSLGFEPSGDLSATERFDAVLAAHRSCVREHFAGLFPDSHADRIVDLFVRSAPRLVTTPGTRELVEDLAGRFAAALEDSADPERALLNLERFVESVGARRFYYELLLDRPELVTRLARLFGASRFLSTVLSTQPQLIEPVFEDPEHLLSSKDELRQALRALVERLRAEGRDEDEVGLASLRLFQMRELVNVGLLDLDGRISLEQVEGALTDLAEVCLEHALALARATLDRQQPQAAEYAARGAFLVVGMGKLGSREMGYGSDLDVIFLYRAEGTEAERVAAQQAFVLLAQKIGWALQTRTAEGICYEVDARLRPSGNQGPLVSSIEGFARYHEQSAAGWERQALLRARPVAGDPQLARAFEAERDTILRRPLPDDFESELERIRQRMEDELAKETEQRRDLKTGRGGLLDVEMLAQRLQLLHGPAHPELLAAQRTEDALARLGELGFLSEMDQTTLSEGATFLKRLASRLRIVENRSISDLAHDRSDLDSVARALGYASSARSGTARLPLLDDYRRHTDAIRTLYARTLTL